MQDKQFIDLVRLKFHFLKSYGYKEVGAVPKIVTFRNNNIRIEVYQGRWSYEIGLNLFGYGGDCSIADIIIHEYPEKQMNYRLPISSDIETVSAVLEEFSNVLQSYGRPILEGKQAYWNQIFLEQKQRKCKAVAKLIVSQIRPEANEAFKKGDYKKAFELYYKIKTDLTPAETKKLEISRVRSEE